MYLLSWKLSWDILSENSQVQNRLVCSHLYKNIGCIHREVHTHLIRKLTEKNMEETIYSGFSGGWKLKM